MAYPNRLPQPVLPAESAWLAAYRQAVSLLSPGVTTLAEAAELARHPPESVYGMVLALRQAGRAEEATDLATKHLRAAALPLAAGPQAQAGLILLLLEEVIGVLADAAEQRILWRLRQDPPVGVRNYWLGDNRIDLVAEARTGSGITVVVETAQPFGLEIATDWVSLDEQVPAGRTGYLLTYLDRTEVRP